MNRYITIFTLLYISCSTNIEQAKYVNYNNAEQFGFHPYYNLKDAVKCSQKTEKPILIMFTASKRLSDPTQNWEILMDTGIKKIIETIGQRNIDIEIILCKFNSQPLYAFVDNNLKQIEEPLAFTPLRKKDEFLLKLKNGINKTRKIHDK